MLKAMPMIMGRLMLMGKRMLIMRPVLIRRNCVVNQQTPYFHRLSNHHSCIYLMLDSARA